MKETVSKDVATVEEVVDLRDDEGSSKAEASIKREGSEELFNRCVEGIVDVPKGNIEGGFRETGVGAGGEGGDGEEAGLIGVGWDDGAGMMGISLEGEDRRKHRGILKNLGDSEEF